MSIIVLRYLDLLDAQRESAFSALECLTDAQLWQRPAPKEWSVGEILDHNYRLIASTYPLVRWIWRLNGWYGRLRRKRPYTTEIEDLYRDPKFPQGNLYLYDPLFGWCNLIVTLRIGIYHDQLHYDDIFKQVAQFKS